MTNSTPCSGDVVRQRSAGAAEAVVEGDGGGERQKASGQAGAQALQRARAVALEGEDVLRAPEDRLDPLADRGEVRPAASFVLAQTKLLSFSVMRRRLGTSGHP